MNAKKEQMDAMWSALALYQPQATTDGHGPTLSLMCSEKTSKAADNASNDISYLVATCKESKPKIEAYSASMYAAEAVASYEAHNAALLVAAQSLETFYAATKSVSVKIEVMTTPKKLFISESTIEAMRQLEREDGSIQAQRETPRG